MADGKRRAVGCRQDPPRRIGDGHIRPGGERSIERLGAQTGQGDDRREHAGEPPLVILGRHAGQKNGLVGIGGAGLAGHREGRSGAERGEPGPGAPKGIGRDGGGRAGHPAQRIEANKVVVPGNAVLDLRQARRALEPERSRRQGLKQDLSGGDPGPGRGRAALGRTGELRLMFTRLASKGQGGLDAAQDQHRRERGDQGEGQAHPNGCSPPASSPDEESHRAPLNLSA